MSTGGHADAQVGPNGEVDGLTARFIDVNGVSTRYYDYGQGDTIVLAGVGTSGANLWSRNIRGLANKFRVPSVKLIVINDTGHFVFREHPEQFNADLIHFIEYWNGKTPSSRGQ